LGAPPVGVGETDAALSWSRALPEILTAFRSVRPGPLALLTGIARADPRRRVASHIVENEIVFRLARDVRQIPSDGSRVAARIVPVHRSTDEHVVVSAV